MFEKEAEEYAHTKHCKKCSSHCEKKCILVKDDYETFKDGAEFGYNKANEWHKLDWEKDFPDIDKLVRVRTKSGEEYICQTYLYYPTEDEIGYGSAITQFEELNGDWVDDNEIGYWCYIEPFKESE